MEDQRKMKREDIVIGERFRKDLGDMESLIKSIVDIGLLHPVVVDGKGNLVAGMRRIEAFRLLGRDEIPVRVIDLDEIVRGEFDENTVRKDFLPTEYVAIAAALRPMEEKAAKERQAVTQLKPGQNVPGGGNLPQPERTGKTRDKIAKGLGIGARTLEKAQAVVEAAAENSELKPIVKEMDSTGNVDGAYKKIKRKKNREKVIEGLREFPGEKYRVIYADPPWKYQSSGLDDYGPAERHYPSMSIQELCDLDISSLCEDNAVLFLWITSPILAEVWPVINAWGFTYKAMFVWDKMAHNYGHYNSVRHEILLICTKGSCVPDTPKLYDSVQSIERTSKHSEKPEEFRQIIDAMYPYGTRIELFARKKTESWDTWGSDV